MPAPRATRALRSRGPVAPVARLPCCAIEAQSGDLRIANAYPAGSEGDVYIDSGDANLANHGIVASIALENQYSLNPA
jgi:hypothetical protein